MNKLKTIANLIQQIQTTLAQAREARNNTLFEVDQCEEIISAIVKLKASEEILTSLLVKTASES